MSNPWDYNEGDGDFSPRATVVQVESLGKGAWAIVTASAVLSAIAIALAMSAWQLSRIAEREARIAQDKYTYTMGELAKQGIDISTDGH